MATANCELRTLNWEWSRAAGKFICGFPRCSPTPAATSTATWQLWLTAAEVIAQAKQQWQQNAEQEKGRRRGRRRGRETNCHRCRWCRRARQISTISVINLPFQSLPVIDRERDSYPLLAWPATRHHHHLLSVCWSVCWWFLINWPAAKPNRPPHMDTAPDQTGCKVSIAPVFCSISSRCAFCFEFSFMLVTPPPHSPPIHSS